MATVTADTTHLTLATFHAHVVEGDGAATQHIFNKQSHFRGRSTGLPGSTLGSRDPNRSAIARTVGSTTLGASRLRRCRCGLPRRIGAVLGGRVG